MNLRLVDAGQIELRTSQGFRGMCHVPIETVVSRQLALSFMSTLC